MRMLLSLALLTCTGSALRSPVSAQAPAEPTPAGPPASTVVPAEPAPPPTSAPAESSPAPDQAPATPPPPPSYPEPSPPGPQRPLGTPEPAIEEGTWDPFAYPYSNVHQHDGFYLRLSLGAAFGAILGDGHVARGVDEVQLDGFGVGTSIAIGAALVPNLILDVDFFYATLFDSDVEVDGDDLGDSSHADPRLGVGEDHQLLGLGLGLTYYLMPVNIYLAGSFGLGRVSFEAHDGDRGASDWGLASNLMVGKEWWVDSDWGIGVAAQLMLVWVDDDFLNDVNAYALSVMFSATYN
jgi:hypothetical protein